MMIKLWMSLGLAVMLGISVPSAFANDQFPAQKTEGKINTSNHKQAKSKFRYYLLHNKELLSLLKTDAKSLKREISSGKSLSEIASDKGVPEKNVVDLLIKQGKDKLQTAVQLGVINQDKAELLQARMSDRMKKIVNKKWENNR